jgi:GT2 family glycosyltransferase
MSGLSVIIPSRNAANLVPCVEAVRKCEPGVRIIVVDDGIDATVDQESKIATAMCPNGGYFPGVKPFVFARNCNLGIKAAGPQGQYGEPLTRQLLPGEIQGDDVILLNDDALLETLCGFTAMQRAAVEHPEFGVISASTNLAGNPDQHRIVTVGTAGLRALGRTPGNSFPTVAFVCVLIPRRTIDSVGLLDEIFTSYGWEDNDYCRRVHLAGLKIGVFDGCFVDHSKLHSTFRGQPRNAGELAAGRKIYLEKWKCM